MFFSSFFLQINLISIPTERNLLSRAMGIVCHYLYHELQNDDNLSEEQNSQYSNQCNCTSNKRNVLPHSNYTSYFECSYFFAIVFFPRIWQFCTVTWIYFELNISSSDNQSVSHWIMFDYFFHVWKVNIFSF